MVFPFENLMQNYLHAYTDTVTYSITFCNNPFAITQDPNITFKKRYFMLVMFHECCCDVCWENSNVNESEFIELN